VAGCAAILAVYMPFCDPPVHPTVAPPAALEHMADLWVKPDNLPSRDLLYGPWGRRRAPPADATFEYVKAKTHGVSPGMTVRDPAGVEWSVKQGPESHVEVTLSRLLSALGYHQPPVYFLDQFRVEEDGATRVERAARFRPHLHELKDEGPWSWQANPFVGTRPYQALLVVMMLFNQSDLKNSNTTRYELSEPRENATTWYVVRDLGTALGETARLKPVFNDPGVFARERFILGLEMGFVHFNYRGWHQELVTQRIAPEDVRWACDLAGELSDAQWADAFRAGGYEPDDAGRFIARLKEKIDEGRRVDAAALPARH
jgi:hypothetical protein